MSVVPIPTTRRMRAWLDREALRIVAGVRLGSFDEAVRSIWAANVARGVDAAEAARDATEAGNYLLARMEQIEALLQHPASPNDRGRLHG